MKCSKTVWIGRWGLLDQVDWDISWWGCGSWLGGTGFWVSAPRMFRHTVAVRAVDFWIFYHVRTRVVKSGSAIGRKRGVTKDCDPSFNWVPPKLLKVDISCVTFHLTVPQQNATEETIISSQPSHSDFLSIHLTIWVLSSLIFLKDYLGVS